MQIRITSGARKHGLTRTRILAALENAELVEKVGDQMVFLGIDNRGVELHIILVPDDKNPDRLACIHAIQYHYLTRGEK
ncbi:hypothetical protein [Nocardia vermiculata]|uniref:Uncharacterized protein n=1 Tax=Nocardia vermiculata TaxID=257274 RepID=A0A846XWG9_9NOCA|nr:hypothetical protein [Nocardia vermiculata]NKY50074.1 hypothetical protein [Nocardia vermiculata]